MFADTAADIITDPDVVEVAKELNGLALALVTAGAYLDHLSTSFADCLYLYKDED